VKLARIALVAILGAASLSASAQAKTSVKLRLGHPLGLGFASDAYLTTASPSTRDFWLSKVRSESGQYVRVDVNWSEIAPETRPSGFNPSDPSSHGYNWSWLDDVIRHDAAHGLNVLLMVYVAPTWAEGPNFPRNDYTVVGGSWKVDPRQLGAFAAALARRYSGTYPDPAHPGTSLPHVQYWQPWNEPNLNNYLSPQWTRSGKHWVPASPDRYRAMLDDFYTAVKAVNPSNVVVSAGTAPYGDPPPGHRMQPVYFYRALFCLNDRLRPLSCSQKVYADAFDAHPYELSAPPTRAAAFKDNVTVPDIWKINRAVKAAVRAGHLLPNAFKPVWTTETGWDSKPPINLYSGVPLGLQADWVEQCDYLLWKQNVRVIMSLKLRDPERADTRGQHVFDGSGVFFASGKPKPAATSFRFPFVVVRQRGNERVAWTRVPASGKLVISERVGGRWVTVGTAQAQEGQVLYGTLRAPSRTKFRASIGSSVSLAWTTR